MTPSLIRFCAVMAVCGASLLSSPASAEVPNLVALPGDELPLPELTFDRIPPTTSWDMGVQLTYGEIGYFRALIPPWIGFGVRGAFGKHFGASRVGGSGSLTVEGPFPIHMSAFFEPQFAWDWIGKKHLLVGAGVGPYVAVHHRMDARGDETAFGLGPSAAVRIGWSEGWTRVGRRVFVMLEGKFRWVADSPSPSVALVVGSGKGR